MASLSFINAIVCGGPGKDLEFRLHMRTEFNELGVGRVVDKLSKAHHDFLETQIGVYQDRAAADEQELNTRFDSTKFNKEDPGSIFEALYSAIKNSRTARPFLSTFQHLYLIPNTPAIRFVLIEKSITCL